MSKTNFVKAAILCPLLLTIFVSGLQAKDEYEISGNIVGDDEEKVTETTVLLLKEDGSESQRTESSKKRFGMGGGGFSFEDVLPGEYSIKIDAGAQGTANVPVSVVDDDVDLGDVILSSDEPKPIAQKEKAEDVSDQPVEQPEEVSGSDKDYVINELNFEVKKLNAEIKHLNNEMEDLKALSKMWINPLAIYSKEIILKNGSTVFGKIVYQDEETLKVETLVGYLIIKRENVVRIIENVVTEESQEYVPEQIRDSYSPPPMPKLAEPQYTSGSLSRDAAKQYSANCVLVGNISEKKDKQGNYIFTGEVKNIGGRRSDFVKVDFVFRKNWSGETKTLTTFVRGAYHTFESGITTDATLLPGASGGFELYVPHSFGSFIGYSYIIDWEEYE
ncbi:MAG: hypothetical protein HOD97_07955 [Candidatus Marinimicrobia bacterium]|jgi:hypothetical protein|nr:hypothetical protein [Candidatus Neomarinimicrobiota bacterium]MBT3617331.1 hypothetical protein [Candidatus Neomarinimicrobiota bacterium]MBT3829271.1 hypothetical protein [Candidatus Neomarinimicrobiota bacterium]MBT3998229.1 hypothetical protein [Candidatus Neomarinimicrobiota bacterium]MBT4281530.1 hypothetical protein [Candidatus Neomarinimicrobiota bacterium]